jgi:tetratricopeptide (TPR) repeat protein/tRNA A-37 threonylcarbamoyl transferase component Bud32
MSTVARLGSYEVLGVIGDGGMGTVYKARDPRFDRLVAIKVLHEQFQRDPAVVDRFKSEAIIQAKLSHPNIVAVYDFIATDAQLAMVLEFVNGLPLDQLIECQRGPIEPRRALSIMSQVLSAMAYAHGQGLVHRDIKPSNIMVQDFGGEDVAKVMDFGIAKILGSEKLRTATSAKMGTLAYMSPEHVRSPRNVDARSDIYSLGATLYELLAGSAPYDADSEFELMQRIIQAPPPRLTTGLSLAPGVEECVTRALAKEPEARYQDCQTFRTAILHCIAALDRPAYVMQPAVAPVVPNFVQPTPVLQVTSAATADPVAATTLSAPERASRRTRGIVAGAAVALALMALLGGYVAYEKVYSFDARLDKALVSDRIFSPPGDCVADLYAAEKARNPRSEALAKAIPKIKAKLAPVGDEAFRRWYVDSDSVDWGQLEKIYALLEELDGGDSTVRARRYYASGQISLQNQNHQQALSHYNEALRHDPNFVLAVNGIAKVYIQDTSPLKNEPLAVQYYQRATTMDPRFTWAFKNLGEYYMRREEWSAAEYYMQQALATSTERPSILRALARIYFNMADYPRALEYNQRFVRVERDPDAIVKANVAIAQIQQKLGQ